MMQVQEAALSNVRRRKLSSQTRARRKIAAVDPSSKRFFVNAGYGDFGKALKRRGWVESKDRFDRSVNIKFTLSSQESCSSDPSTITNHCRGEGCMTCKTLLIDTLKNAQEFWASWLTNPKTGESSMRISGYDQAGVDAFFPRQYIISNSDDQQALYEDMLFTQCESHLKQFIKAYEKESGFVNAKGTCVIEKLVVCSNMILRKVNMKKMDDVLKEHKKHKDAVVHGLSISKDEQAAITHASYPDSYIKFLQKEDWYIKMYNNVAAHFKKDKSLKSKVEKQQSLWRNIYSFCKELVQDLQMNYPQTDLNGSNNLWIVKPGGLSRGRKIKLFDNYVDICKYAELPYALAPSGLQLFDATLPQVQFQTATKKTWVCQKYIENPLLLMSRKFDIRVWVVVTSWNPLKVYYYKNCYARFGAADYDAQRKDNLFAHLTNNTVTSKQIKIGDDKNYDKIPGNMWFLE